MVRNAGGLHRRGRKSPPAIGRWSGHGALLAVAAVLVLSVAFEATAFALTANADGASAIAAAKKKKKKKKTCVIVTVAKGGKKTTTYYVRVYAYKTVGGKRKIVRKRVKLTFKATSCTKRCIATRAKTGGGWTNRFVKRTRKVLVKKGSRLVSVKKRVKVPVLVSTAKCLSGIKGTSSGNTAYGVPVTVDLLPGSYATLDFGEFQRKANITGRLTGFHEGIIKPLDDIDVVLTKGSLDLARTAIIIDDECSGQVGAAIQTGPTVIRLDTTRQSTTTLFANQNVTAVVYVVIRATLQLRDGDDGCNNPYLQTGWTETKARFFVKGRTNATDGLKKLKVTSGEQLLDGFDACLWPGDAAAPCRGQEWSVPFPFLVSTNLITKVVLGRPTTIQIS